MSHLSAVHKTDKLSFPFLYVTGAPPVPTSSGSNPGLAAFVTAVLCTSAVHGLWGFQSILCMLRINCTVCSGLIALYNIPRKYKITFLIWRWRTTCQRNLKVVLIRHSWQTQKPSEVHRGLSRLLSDPLVLIDAYVAFFPVLCTKLPSLLSIRCQSGFPHVYVGLYLSVYFSSCLGCLSSHYQRAF